MHKEYNDVIRRQDAATFERLLTDDFTNTTSDGQIASKAPEIAFVKSSEIKFTSSQNDDIKVRLYGSLNVVTR